MRPGESTRASLVPGLAAVVLTTAYVIALLAVERQALVIGLLAAGIAAVLAAAWLGLSASVSRSFAEREDVLGAGAILAVCAVAAFFHDNHFVLLLVVTVLLYTVATLGLNIQFGYAGVLNFAGASFFGIGAYTASVLNAHTAVPHLLVLAIGGLLAAAIGSLLLLPVLRTRGHYAAVVTIAFALLLKTFLEVNDVLGGPQGMQVKAMRVLGWSFNDNVALGGSVELSFYMNYFAVSLPLLIGAFVMVRRLERSWIGLNLDALRLDETAAGCFGLDVARWKITAFLIGNFLIGIARFADPGVDPAARRHRQSLGPGGGDGHRHHRSGEAADDPGIPFPAVRADGDRGPPVPPRGPAAAAGAQLLSGMAAVSDLLVSRALTKRFGGVVALDQLDLVVARNEILGLIGPNGSGKTTFFNVVTGIYRADAGAVSFDDRDVTSASAQAIYDYGISRTFQRSRLSLPLSIFDNVIIGNHKRLTQGLWFNLVRRGRFRQEFERNYRAARALIEVFEPALAERMFEPVAGLPMIDRRRIEICRALISEPKLLLLDEPSAGMTHEETAELMNDIMQVRDRNRDLTIVIVEHEMGVIERITDRCVVLNFGRKIAEGPYRQVAADRQVQEAYLGVG